MINPRLQKFYQQVVCEDFLMLYNFTNISALPQFEQVILTSTSNNFTTSKACVVQSFCANYLQTNQKCTTTRARKSVDLFNIRKSNLLGLKITLRNKKLFSFLDKLSIFVLPKLFSKTNNLKKTRNLHFIDDGQKSSQILVAKPSSFVNQEKKQDMINNVFRTLSSPLETKNNSFQQKKTFFDRVASTTGENQLQYYSKNQKARARKLFFSKKQPLVREAVESKSLIVNRSHLTSTTQNCFTVSNKSSLFFFEVSQLSIFFDSLPGFALSFFFAPLKNRIFTSSGMLKANPTVSPKWLLSAQALTPLREPKGVIFGAPKAQPKATNFWERNYKIKNHLLSAFGFPWSVE